MTVASEINHNQYVGNGVTTSFDYQFRVFKASHLQVQTSNLDGGLTMLVLNTDYTVTGVGSVGGKVVLTAPLANGWGITIDRDLPLVQETDLRNQGTFYAETHEDTFDYLTMLIQRVYSLFGLALRRPSWLSKFYDALGNRISNLGTPVNPQDAVTKKYADDQYAGSLSHADDQFKRTLRVPESSIDMLPAAAVRRGKVQTYDAATGQPLLVPAGQLSVGDIVNLMSADGYKYIGRCPNVATLRTIEPSFPGQKIELVCYRSGGNIFDGSGGDLFYDSTDTTSADNGITIFVTAGGKRWKRENHTKEINLAWGGLEYGGEIAAIWQKAIDLAIAATRKTNTTADTPPIKVLGGMYSLSAPVVHPPFVRSVAYGDVFIQSKLTGNQRAVSVKGVPGYSPSYSTAHPTFSGVGGAFDLSGLGRNTESLSLGLVIGNDITNNQGANGTGTTGCKIEDFRCSGFGATLGFTGYDAYLISFHNCAFGLARSHIKTLDTLYRNSGERISFYNCTLWGGGEDGYLNINCPQFDFQFISGSWDYSAGDYIVTGPNAGWSTVIIDAVHMEGVEGKIVNSVSASSRNVAILFTKADYLPTGTYGSKVSNSPSRKLVTLPDDGSVTVEIDELSLRHISLPNKDDILMSNSPFVRVNSLWRTIYPVIPSPAHIKNRGYNFADETEGAIFNSANPLVRFTHNSSGGLTAKVGKLSDSSKCLSLTVANNLANISLSTSEFMPVDRRRKYTMSCAVQYLLNTQVNVDHRFQWYDKDLNLISNDEYLYFMTTAMNDTNMDNYSDGGNRKMPSFATYRNPPAGASYMKATIAVSQLSSDANITNFMVGEV